MTELERTLEGQLTLDALEQRVREGWVAAVNPTTVLLLIDRLRQAEAAAHYAVQRLLFAMHIYPGYQVQTRGPSGCIIDAIRSLSPETAEKLYDAVDPGDLLERDDPRPEAVTPNRGDT